MSLSFSQIGVTLVFFHAVLLKGNRLNKGFINHICQWENLPKEIYGADSLHKTRSIPNISLVDLLGRDPKHVLIYSLDIFLKRKLWILFGPFQKQLSYKFWNFEFILLRILAKRWFKSFADASVYFYQVRVFLFPTTFSGSFQQILWIFSLLDNTRYFIP